MITFQQASCKFIKIIINFKILKKNGVKIMDQNNKDNKKDQNKDNKKDQNKR